MQSSDIKELAAALVKVQAVMEPVKRTCENPDFRSEYADLAAIWQATRKHLADNGLCVVQAGDVTPAGSPVLVTTLAHISGQWISGTMPLVATNLDDPQKLVAAITYIRRAALSAIIGACQEGEDDDGNKAGNAGHTESIPAAAPTAGTAPAPTAAPETGHHPKPKGEIHTEEMTFEPAKPGKTKTGKTVYRYRGGDEKFYSTFDAAMAKQMDALIGEICQVQHEQTQNGAYENHNVLMVRKAPPAGAQQEPEDDLKF
jgi:hypothetical protein